MSIRNENSKSYLNDRLIVNRSEYVVIFTNDAVTPLCCPVCCSVLRSRIDEEEFKKNCCCSDCAKIWAYPNISKWKNGWRPSIDDILKKEKAMVEFVIKID